MDTATDWQQSNLQVFWGEIAPSHHLVQVYDNDEVFIQSLVGYVGSGFIAGDCMVIIATKEHKSELDKRLAHHGFDIKGLAAKQQYICLDAQETLSSFMVNEMPDQLLFNAVIPGIISKAKTKGRRIRAFGEMVVLLWQQGNKEATVRLEEMWNNYISKEDFCLFCAYPRASFGSNPADSIDQICSCHTKVIGGWNKSSTEIYYKDPFQKQV
jgi:hypothetical protein